MPPKLGRSASYHDTRYCEYLEKHSIRLGLLIMSNQKVFRSLISVVASATKPLARGTTIYFRPGPINSQWITFFTISALMTY